MQGPLRDCLKTRSAYFWSRALSGPFWGIIPLLSFILYKEFEINALHISVLIAMKPMAGLLSPYWSASLDKRPDRLVPNLIVANILQFIPFIFVPWIKSPWYPICAFGFYMVLKRGVIPAWMEVLKQNLNEKTHTKVFAFGSALDYLATAILPLFFGFLLDTWSESWRFIIAFTALIGIASTYFIAKIEIKPVLDVLPRPEKMSLLKPWKQTWNLLKRRPDFLQFQWGFMLGGAGLMILQPVLPKFFVDELGLSYTKMAIALIVCRSIGYAATTNIWARYLHSVNLFRFSAIVTTLAAAFPFFVIASKTNLSYLYFAYISYGIMKAGSDMSWSLSGPRFARHEDSSIYTQTNVLTVGVRGCILPFLGTLIYNFTGAIPVLLLGALLCILATRHMSIGARANILEH